MTLFDSDMVMVLSQSDMHRLATLAKAMQEDQPFAKRFWQRIEDAANKAIFK